MRSSLDSQGVSWSQDDTPDIAEALGPKENLLP